MELSQIVEKHHQGGRGKSKPWHYWSVYKTLFEARRDESLRLLELGVQAGQSMRIWEEYLPSATVVGLDYNAEPDGYPARAHYVRGRQEDPSALTRAVELAGGAFDVIIDDAAHVGRLAKASHEFLYRDYLVPGGLYIFEDWGVAMRNEKWVDYHEYVPEPDHGDLLPSFQYGMVGLVKQQIDRLLTSADPSRVDVHRGVVVTVKAAP